MDARRGRVVRRCESKRRACDALGSSLRTASGAHTHWPSAPSASCTPQPHHTALSSKHFLSALLDSSVSARTPSFALTSPHFTSGQHVTSQRILDRRLHARCPHSSTHAWLPAHCACAAGRSGLEGVDLTRLRPAPSTGAFAGQHTHTRSCGLAELSSRPRARASTQCRRPHVLCCAVRLCAA